MYLYVDKKDGVDRVPEELLARFGKLEHAMTLLLHPERSLARADVGKVLLGIEEQGYFLQLPPKADTYMTDLHNKNSKI